MTIQNYQDKRTAISTGKVDAKCFQRVTMEMKINLGLKYSLLSQVSNAICLHSTRIYAPFQPDKNLILSNKALQIEFKGGEKKKKTTSISQLFPEPHNSRLQLREQGKLPPQSGADIRPLDTAALAGSYAKINTNSARFCYENKAMKFPRAHLPKGQNSAQLCQRGFLKPF